MRKGWGGQSSSDKLPWTDHSPPTTAHLCHPARGKVKEWNEEGTLSLAKEGVGKVLFKLTVFLARQVCFNWQSSYFFYKLNLFSCDNKWFPCPYLNPWTSSPYFFLLPCWRGWMRKGQGGCFPVSQRQSTTLPFYLRNWDAGLPTENASPGVGWPCTGDCHWDLWGPVTLSSGLSHVFSFHCTNFCWPLNGFSLVLFFFHLSGSATAAPLCLPSHIPSFLQSLQKTTSSTCLAKPWE